jgi:hypothetical protein
MGTLVDEDALVAALRASDKGQDRGTGSGPR